MVIICAVLVVLGESHADSGKGGAAQVSGAVRRGRREAHAASRRETEAMTSTV